MNIPANSLGLFGESTANQSVAQFKAIRKEKVEEKKMRDDNNGNDNDDDDVPEDEGHEIGGSLTLPR